MTFSTTSFFAGVGTVFAAVTIGFAGGALITSSPKVEPNRLERVLAGNQVPSAAKVAEIPAVPSVPAAKAEAAPVPATKPEAPAPVVVAKNATPETSASDRVIAITPATASQPVAPAQAQPVAARDSRDDTTSQIDNAKKIRESELKKQAADSERRMDQRRERSRKRQEIEAAVNAVRRMQRDGAIQEVSQQDDGPRLGFFGHD